jgi:LacI family transcriptional regulator
LSIGSRNIGIKDVAAAAGVSVTTVSHVLNEVTSARISPETRERVRSAAGQLGYGPNSVARALRTSRTALLGLVIEDAGRNPHAGQIVLGADEAARARGYNLLVVNTSPSAGPEARKADVESLLMRRVDGILYAPRHPGQLPAPPTFRNVPTVLVNAAGTQNGIPAVAPEEESGPRAAVGCLLGAGHTRIGFISSGGAASCDGANFAEGAAGQERAGGFPAALAQAGFDGGAGPVESGQPDERGGYAAARSLLDREDRPTGLVCHNDLMAMGAYRAAADLGFAIPRDLSVVALADHGLIAANLYPALTTVALPPAELAARAAGILMDTLEGTAGTNLSAGPAAGPAYTLIARGSVAPPPDAATPRGNF